MAAIFARELVKQGKFVLMVAMTNAATDHLAIVTKGLGVDVVRHYSSHIPESSRDPTLSTSATVDLKNATCIVTTAVACGSAAFKGLVFDYAFVDEVSLNNIHSIENKDSLLCGLVNHHTCVSFRAASWWSHSL